MTSQKSKSIELAPVRSMSEFVLDGSRYQMPAFNDLKSFNNRVCSNLLYFQTNYLIVSVATLLIFLAIGFNKMLCGGLGIGLSAMLVLFILDKVPQVSALKAQYPIAVFGLGALDLLVCYLLIKSIMFFLLSILLPILFWILHASVRSRGVSNKVKNKMEQMGLPVYDNTPMCMVLTTLGISVKDLTD